MIDIYNVKVHFDNMYNTGVKHSQQCGMLTKIDSDEPVQPLFKLRNS